MCQLAWAYGLSVICGVEKIAISTCANALDIKYKGVQLQYQNIDLKIWVFESVLNYVPIEFSEYHVKVSILLSIFNRLGSGIGENLLKIFFDSASSCK